MNTGNHQSSKQRGQVLGWKVHEGAHLLFFIHTLCMNYVIAMFLLVCCMNTRNDLLYFARFYALLTPKIANKNPQQRTLPGFITICHVLAKARNSTTLLSVYGILTVRHFVSLALHRLIRRPSFLVEQALKRNCSPLIMSQAIITSLLFDCER